VNRSKSTTELGGKTVTQKDRTNPMIQEVAVIKMSSQALDYGVTESADLGERPKPHLANRSCGLLHRHGDRASGIRVSRRRK
jgi:hypothetical protein